MERSTVNTSVNNQRGFSLVELMVVVAIIGVLAAIAIPKFGVFQIKARQAEAKSNLSAIYTLEQAYQAEKDSYGNIAPITSGAAAAPACPVAATAGNDIGFVLNDCTKLRYSYSTGGVGPNTFIGTATSGSGALNKVAPGCTTIDTFTINANATVTNAPNAATSC